MRSAILPLVVLAGASAAFAKEPCPYSSRETWQLTVPEKYQRRAEYAFVESDPALPNVLLIGDSISMSYTVRVRERLAGIANVYRAPDNCRSTRQTLDAKGVRVLAEAVAIAIRNTLGDDERSTVRWTGDAKSASWNDPGNWDIGVPDKHDVVFGSCDKGKEFRINAVKFVGWPDDGKAGVELRGEYWYLKPAITCLSEGLP